MELKQTISIWVRQARKEAGLSGEMLGAKLSLEPGAPTRGFTRANISHWETGKHSPNLQQLIAIAKITGKGLPSTIVSAMQSGKDEQSNVEAGPDIRGQVPLISWVAAGAFCESPDNFAPGDAEKWLSCPVPHGKYTYCLRVVGKSMDNGDDGYRDGEIIFVDPDAEAMPGKDAIVRTPNGESTFKRLKQDIDGLYLQALNPRWEPNYFKLPEGSHICGIVIFAGRER